MMRKGGIGALKAQQARQSALKETGEKVQEELLLAMRTQMRQFQESLETYAREHKKEIQNNPELRRKFHKMCSDVGVDPLVSSKNQWTSLGIGDFYFELAVRTVEICLATRSLNGGIIDAEELLMRLQKKRIKYTEEITIDDIEKAVKKLHIFGGGFALLKLGKKYVVRSVPVELDRDHTIILGAVEQEGHGTQSQITQKVGWDEGRFHKAMNFLLENEMVWVDDQAESRIYWFLGLVHQAEEQPSEQLASEVSNVQEPVPT
uniref:Vacuolar-sorting protein SNF8 n=1 Tax=Rhodosorus marinus TaxID=101924 RepID=A0A7S2ZR22_9RHOD